MFHSNPNAMQWGLEVGYVARVKLNGPLSSLRLVCVFNRRFYGRFRAGMFAWVIQGQAIMNLKWASRIAALSLGAFFCSVSPHCVAAQDQVPQAQAPQEPASRWLWSWFKDGKISFNARFRIEGFERDGPPFTATAYAPVSYTHLTLPTKRIV